MVNSPLMSCASVFAHWSLLAPGSRKHCCIWLLIGCDPGPRLRKCRERPTDCLCQQRNRLEHLARRARIVRNQNFDGRGGDPCPDRVSGYEIAEGADED